MKKIYISGAMATDPNHVEKFKKVEQFLQRFYGEKYKIINPVTIGEKLQARNHKEPCYAEYLLQDLKELAKCDVAYFLDDYKTSRGAKVEYNFCVAVGIPRVKIGLD